MRATVLKCEFVPQAWINDYAVTVDPEGPTTWLATWNEETKNELTPWAQGDLPEPLSEESDNLRFTEGAPAWCREWGGPFEVRYEVAKGVYGEWCRDPVACIPRGFCPKDPTCAD